MLDKLKKILGAKPRENYVEKSVEDLYRGISQETELSPEEVAMIGGVESQHGKYTKNMAGSSAKGTMQVMPRLAAAIRPGSEKSLGDRNTQQSVASDFLNLNTPTIKELAQGANKQVDIADHYAMYNLGKGMGKKYLSAKDDEDISKILPANVIKSNPKLYKYKTVGESKRALKKFLEERGSEFEFSPSQQDFQELFNKEEE